MSNLLDGEAIKSDNRRLFCAYPLCATSPLNIYCDTVERGQHFFSRERY